MEKELIIFIVTGSFIAGLCIGIGINECYYRATLIKKGFAEYNTKTGVWQWKNTCDKE